MGDDPTQNCHNRRLSSNCPTQNNPAPVQVQTATTILYGTILYGNPVHGCTESPYSDQGPVDPSRLIDRRAELDGLQSAAGDRVAIRLAAPRRFGKTSVLDAHVAAMRAVGHRAVRDGIAAEQCAAGQ
jgi:hypothetical protein